MLLLVFCYFIWDFPSRCRRFNPSLYCLSPFPLSCITVSRPWHLSEFYPNKALILHGPAKIWNISSWDQKYFTSEPCEQVSYKYFIFQHVMRNHFFVSPSGHVLFYLLFKHQWNTKQLHFNFFCLESAICIFIHSNCELCTCEDSIIFLHVKLSCFCVKAHLAFHCCKMIYREDITWPCRDAKFLFQWAQQMSEIFFNTRREISYLQVAM